MYRNKIMTIIGFFVFIFLASSSFIVSLFDVSMANLFLGFMLFGWVFPLIGHIIDKCN